MAFHNAKYGILQRKTRHFATQNTASCKHGLFRNRYLMTQEEGFDTPSWMADKDGGHPQTAVAMLP